MAKLRLEKGLALHERDEPHHLGADEQLFRDQLADVPPVRVLELLVRLLDFRHGPAERSRENVVDREAPDFVCRLERLFERRFAGELVRGVCRAEELADGFLTLSQSLGEGGVDGALSCPKVCGRQLHPGIVLGGASRLPRVRASPGESVPGRASDDPVLSPDGRDGGGVLDQA